MIEPREELLPGEQPVVELAHDLWVGRVHAEVEEAGGLSDMGQRCRAERATHSSVEMGIIGGPPRVCGRVTRRGKERSGGRMAVEGGLHSTRRDWTKARRVCRR